MADGDNVFGGNASIADLNTTLQLANQNMSKLIQTIMAAFPQAGAAITHSATAGSDTLPATPAGFLTVTVSGVAFKVPLYNP